MPTHIEKVGVIYTQHDNGIHEFIFTGVGDDGLDDFFDILVKLIKETPVDATIRYIVDASNSKGRGAMAELVKRFRKVEAQLPVRAAGRTAILHDRSLLLTLANTFIDTLAPSKDRSRFFQDREEAIQWLLSK